MNVSLVKPQKNDVNYTNFAIGSLLSAYRTDDNWCLPGDVQRFADLHSETTYSVST